MEDLFINCAQINPFYPDFWHILQRIESKIDELSSKRALIIEPVPKNEVWLDARQVMEILFIEERSFYRRQKEGLWVRKKIGGKWYYLKDSVI